MGVGCKLVQFVVYSVLFVMMSTKMTVKKLSCFRGGTCLDSLWRPNRKKNGTKKPKTASPGVEPGLSARSSNSLTTAPQWHTIWKINFVMSKQFFSAIDAVWSCWSCIYHEFKYTLRKISLSAYFKAISHYFGFNWPTRCRQSIELALLNSVEN